MSKTSNIFLAFATIALSISIILPLQVAAETNEGASEKQLFQAIQSIEMDDGFTIPEHTLIYGTELEGTVEIQYGQMNTKIDRELVINEGITEESAVFMEYDEDSIILKELQEGTTLTTTNEDNPLTITVNHTIEYPVHINDEKEETLLIGNVVYQILYLEVEEEEIISPPITEVVEEETDMEEAEEKSTTEKEMTEDEPTTEKEEPTTDKEVQVEATPSAVKPVTSSNPWEGVSSNYFKVTSNRLAVYDNRTGALIQVGTLEAGKEYKRVSDYGNWHRIQFGNIYGYVRKSETIPSNGSTINNENSAYKNTSRSFTSLEDVIIYDNKSGSLVAFGTIDKDVTYSIASNYGNWWRIVYSDMVGYVNKNSVRENFSFDDQYFRVTKDKLPVYDNRTGSLIEVGTLEKGVEYKRLRDYGNWHRIQFGNIYGYVKKSDTEPSSGAFIKNENKQYKNTSKSFRTLKDVIVYDNTSGSLVPFGTIGKGVNYTIASDYGNWWRIIYSDKVGYVHKNSVNVSFSKSDAYFKVTTDNLPIYDNRTGALIKVGTLEKGKEYKRVSDYGNWHRIQFGDIYGYVLKADTEFTFGNSIKNDNKRYHNTLMNFTALKDVIVYDNSSGSLVQIGTIDKNVEYAIASDYGNWWRIVYSDTVGYVHKNEVKLNAIKIFLDAGHGGSDPGGSGYGLQEKAVVLDIALKTANYLRSNYGNVVVEMSRTTDKYLSLKERSSMANRWGADYLVSLHTNAWLGKGQGFESFIYNGTVSQETRDRQVDIHDYLSKHIPVVDRGKKRANFHMVRETTMPSLLLEYMFIDNKRENDMLRNASYRTKLARLTAEAIAKSFNLPIK